MCTDTVCWLILCARQRIVFVVSWYLIWLCGAIWIPSNIIAADDDFSHPFHCSSSRRILSDAFQYIHVLQSHSYSNECLCNSSSSWIVHTRRQSTNKTVETAIIWLSHSLHFCHIFLSDCSRLIRFDRRLNRVCTVFFMDEREFYGHKSRQKSQRFNHCLQCRDSWQHTYQHDTITREIAHQSYTQSIEPQNELRNFLRSVIRNEIKFNETK